MIRICFWTAPFNAIKASGRQRPENRNPFQIEALRKTKQHAKMSQRRIADAFDLIKKN
jgi:hypothetical protein